MPILNPTDFIDIKETDPNLGEQENVISQKCFNAGSSIRLLEHVNTLNGAKFEKCVFSNLNWMNKSIKNKIIFEKCLFKGGATSFENAKFEQDVSFNGCVFENNVSFDNTIFHQNASFRYIHTLGDLNAKFLFRSFAEPTATQNFGLYKLDFSNAMFETPVYFNGRHFSHITSFIGVTFMNLFFFDNADFGSQTYFVSPKYTCVEHLDLNDPLTLNQLARSFQNLIDCLEKIQQDVSIEKKIKNKLVTTDEPVLIETAENKFVSAAFVVKYLNIKTGTLTSYTKRYPLYFEKVGCGHNRTYNFEKIKEFQKLGCGMRKQYLAPTDPKLNKKAGYHYASAPQEYLFSFMTQKAA